MSTGIIVEYRYIRLKPADNGFILTYDEIKEKPGTMDNRDSFEREMVFGDSVEDLDAAMDAMKKMYMFNKMRKGNPSIPAPSLSVAKAES